MEMLRLRFVPLSRWMSTQPPAHIKALIEGDIRDNDVMVYMKGVPDAPQCGFSKRVVQLLQTVGVEFAARDVLADPELRQGVKDFAQWPTLPQVYIKGEFMGGSDTLFEMFKSGELDQLLNDKGVPRIKDKQ